MQSEYTRRTAEAERMLKECGKIKHWDSSELDAIWKTIFNGRADFTGVRLLISIVAPEALRNAPTRQCQSEFVLDAADQTSENKNKLLYDDFDINAKDDFGNALLHAAVARNDNQLVGLLLSSGADVNCENDLGETPLFLVQEQLSCHDLLQQLVDNGAKSDARNVEGDTALSRALVNKTDKVAAFLLAENPQLVNISNYKGNLPIHCVQTATVLNALVDLGTSDLTARNNIGASPLCTLLGGYNRWNEIIDAVEIMLTRCPSLASMCDKSENTALHYLALYYTCDRDDSASVYKLVDLLTTRGCSINACNVYGQTPLYLCCTKDSVMACVKAGADLNIRDKLGRNYLHYAMFYRNVLFVDLLSTCICDVDIWDRTPLHNAQLALRHRPCELALKTITATSTGFRIVDAADRFGKTALHYAEFNGYVLGDGASRILVQLEADTTARDGDDALPSKLGRIVNEKESKRTSLLAGEHGKRLARLNNALHENETETTDRFDDDDVLNRTPIEMFWQMIDSGKLSVCKDCGHLSLLNKSPNYIKKPDYSSACMYRLRPARDASAHLIEIWKTGEYAYRNPLTQSLSEKVCDFMGRVVAAIEADDERFAGRLVQIGSSYEGSRVGVPDEFDFSVQLCRFQKLVHPEPLDDLIGFFRLKSNSNCDDADFYSFRKFFTDGCLLTTDVQMAFELIMKKVLHSPEFWQDERFFELANEEASIQEEEYIFNPLKACTTVRLRTFQKIGPEDSDYFHRQISIDIGPCIHKHGWWPTSMDRLLPDVCRTAFLDKANVDEVLKDGASLVFFQPNTVYRSAKFSNVCARVSFAVAESRLIRNCVPTVKAAHMVCKWVVEHYTYDSDDNHLWKDYSFDSHVLKTAVLMTISKLDQMSASKIAEACGCQVDGNELTEWVRNIFRCLIEFAGQDFVPTFFMSYFRLPVWKFERYVSFSHSALRRHGSEYGRRTDRNLMQSIATSHLQYWSLLDEGADMSVNFPQIMKTVAPCGLNFEEKVEILSSHIDVEDNN